MKIGIVGTESDHAEDLLRLANLAGRWPGVEVVAMWGAEADRERTRGLAADYGVGAIVEAPEGMLGQVDAVAVLSRHPGEHTKQARPFLAAGVPVLVDKALCSSVADAESLVELAARSDCRLMAASALRWQPDLEQLKRWMRGGATGVTASGSFYPDSPYGGSGYYGVHVVEMALELVGTIGEVRVAEAGESSLVLEGESGGVAVAMRMVRPAEGEASQFSVTVRTAAGETARPIRLAEDYMAPVYDRFVAMAAGGPSPVSAEQMLATVRILEFGERQLRLALGR